MLIPLDYLDEKYGLEITGIVHCGGHLGEEAKAYSDYTDTVLWIEGNPDLIPQLRLNVAPYHHDVACALLGSEAGVEVNFNVANNGESSSVLELGTHAEKHPEVEFVGTKKLLTRTIDDVVMSHWAVGSNFLALDLQGYELEALKGATRTLAGARYVYVEVNVDELYVGCARLADLNDFLEEQGFALEALKMAGDTGWGDGFYKRKEASRRHYKIIVAGYNCVELIQNCVDSIASQTYTNYDVCMVDDASTDEGQAALVQRLAEEHGWKFLLRSENAGALRSQHEGIMLLDPKDGDVIVWVDMDDAFASPDSLAILDSYYDDDTPMTYGSYQSVPYSATCPQPSRYPAECEAANDYRSLRRWGIHYNHLRTVRWELYKRLDVETDFMFEGEWMHLASDTAVMIPCLEMSGGKYKFIPEVLYSYTSDNPLSEWRKSPDGTNRMHAALAAGRKKDPVWLEGRRTR